DCHQLVIHRDVLPFAGVFSKNILYRFTDSVAQVSVTGKPDDYHIALLSSDVRINTEYKIIYSEKNDR
ncbi:hypothetical protein, partial [Escherichia coli]|uniref:hypothetical protein n=1 Tax=Escherichia coli TaxID=562 RepID=UPI001BEB758E